MTSCDLVFKLVPEFEKDLKRLHWHSLEKDLARYEKVLNTALRSEYSPESHGLFPIQGLNTHPLKYKPFVGKKFFCEELKNKGNQSGIRIVFVYEAEKNTVHFIEIYFKGTKEVEDKERLNYYLTSGKLDAL